ncbi:MAG: hypothetical protein IPP76_01250 [Moraxellaceae bacterium]|nr:hypothetical protein [Moraxellaceae bacterium]
MNNRPSRTQLIAYIASLAAKSKTEDSDVLFFKGGVYKGEWNPNTVANQLPVNTQVDDIFLVSEHGSYFGRTLVVGELVRFVSQHDPILVYSKYLPIPFFLSMLESDSSSNTNTEQLLTSQQIKTLILTELENATSEISNAVKTLAVESSTDELNNLESQLYIAVTDAVKNSTIVENAITESLEEGYTLYEGIATYVTDSCSGNGHAVISGTIELFINNYADDIGVGSNGQPHATVQESALFVIENNLETGGVIDSAIQSALNTN